MRRAADNRGIAYILALALLATFSAMAVAYAAQTNSSMVVADNTVHIQDAQFQAESGMSYLSRVLQSIPMLPGATNQQALTTLNQNLPSAIGSANLNGQSIGFDGTSTITVPFIKTDSSGHGFGAQLALSGTDFVLTVTGRNADPASQARGPNAIRKISLRFQAAQKTPGAFNYGVASKSQITLTGNTRIDSTLNPKPKIYSGTYTHIDAVDITGNCAIGSDLDIANPDGMVSLTGNCSIGGATVASGHIQDHINIGVGQTDFPQPDPSVFAPFATNIVDSSTNTNGNKTFTNIRIRANTNPTFSGNITLQGVVYIETPNVVSFSGNLAITGVVVTQDAGDGNLANNSVNFTGNTSVLPVTSLPNTAPFATLRTMPGTFLLAPGFAARFTGNFGTISGTMAADSFQFTGNAGGTVNGWVMNWGDTAFSMTGNSNLVVNPPANGSMPPGFGASTQFLPEQGTYSEPAP
jgi:hypothetical protein